MTRGIATRNARTAVNDTIFAVADGWRPRPVHRARSRKEQKKDGAMGVRNGLAAIKAEVSGAGT